MSSSGIDGPRRSRPTSSSPASARAISSSCLTRSKREAASLWLCGANSMRKLSLAASFGRSRRALRPSGSWRRCGPRRRARSRRPSPRPGPPSRSRAIASLARASRSSARIDPDFRRRASGAARSASPERRPIESDCAQPSTAINSPPAATSGIAPPSLASASVCASRPLNMRAARRRRETRRGRDNPRDRASFD